MKNLILPKEREPEKTGRGGIALVHYAFNYDHWEFRQETGADRGRDCSIEYICNNEWHNGIIRGQVKGTKTPETYMLKGGKFFSYQLEKKTINYALRSKDAFLLFLCDLKNEIVYYLPIQDYFIEDPTIYKRLEKESESMNLRIPISNIVLKYKDEKLVQLSQASYSFINNRVIKTATFG